MEASHIRTCTGCLERAFTRPVAVFPGFAGPDCAVLFDLCLWCRVGWRDDQWCSLVESCLHHRRREVREQGQWALEWMTRAPAQGGA